MLDTYMHYATFSLWYRFQHCPWGLGQGDVGMYTRMVQTAWVLLGLAVEKKALAQHWWATSLLLLHKCA